MATEKLKDWQVPYQAEPESKKLGWLNELVEEGEIWQKGNRGGVSISDIKEAMSILAGDSIADATTEYRSKLGTGRLKRDVREVVGAVSNIRPIWGYGTDNSTYNSKCLMMNQVTRAMYLENNLDGGIKDTMQWSAVSGTGWLWPKYRRTMYGTGRGNLTFHSYGAPCVLPYQLPSNNDWQEAYAVTLMDEMPIAMAHGMFPKFQERLQPTKSKYWYAQEIRQAARANLMSRVFGRSGKSNRVETRDLYVPIRYTWVIDLSINTTDSEIPMGTPDSSWFYKVPALKSEIPVGRNAKGEMMFVMATEDHARLYPNRRLIISSEDVVMYDGPAFDWHGELPLIDFSLDKWVWEAIGYSLVSGNKQIQKSIDELERGVMDIHKAKLDPPLAYDLNSVTKKQADVVDPMKPRARYGFDGAVSEKPFQDVVPESYRQVDPATQLYIQHLEETMDHQFALKDIMALAKARAGGGLDDYQKLMEAEGPIVNDITRNVERSLARVGNQTKYIILQYCDTRRLMEYVGPDGVDRVSFDYDPMSLVPSHLPNESSDKDSIYTRYQRAKFLADNLRFYITPHSAHELTQMSHKLLLIQLRKAGVQIDSRTIAEACDIANFGNEPKGNTVWQRYWAEQEETAQHAIRVKQIVDDIIANGVSPTPAMQGALGDTPPGTPPREGRPTTGQEAPRLVQKDGGQRSTISESGS